MIGYFLLGIAVSVLATMVINVIRMTVAKAIERIKVHRGKKVALQRAKQTLADLLEMKAEGKLKETTTSIEELEALLGEEGCVEFTVNDAGKVNADDIQILQAESMEDKLSQLFDKNNGMLVMAT